jgi:hypothetical protein
VSDFEYRTELPSCQASKAGYLAVKADLQYVDRVSESCIAHPRCQRLACHPTCQLIGLLETLL